MDEEIERLVVSVRADTQGFSRDVQEMKSVLDGPFGEGVERIFPLHSPTIEKIDVLRGAQVRRAKLYFLRELKGKAARMKEQKRPVQ